ncbi:MAG TPA: DUF4389 domain-containing protein [Aliiroseovarius sp.]|nr:DUF4389 domain-containing protein [Aliiroseovarius sp.]
MTHSDHSYDPRGLDEPDGAMEPRGVLLRGLWMVVFAILLRFAGLVLGLAALIQFFWMLIGKEKNPNISGFGTEMADWMSRVTRFQTGMSEDKPFPFDKWGPQR